jgi:hypothetical protein
MALTRTRKIAFALAAMAMSFFGVVLLLLAADLVLHYRAERSAGLNRYGYRGPVAPSKQEGELRIVMLGGSTVFGYGVGWNESIPFVLEARLRERLSRPVSVINLGFNNEGAFAFKPNLEDFDYLDYDLVVLYEGYNDLAGDDDVNRAVYRRTSAVYRLTGYYPILPLYLDEKAKMLRHGSDLNQAYEAARREERGDTTVVFRPNLAQRTSAGAVEAIAAMTKALDGQLAEKERSRRGLPESESPLGCKHPHVTYCDSVAAAFRFARDKGRAVVVVSQPRLPGPRSFEFHSSQHAMLGGLMSRVFGSDSGVVWADLSNLLDLTDPNVTFDAMHLNPQSNAKVASALVEPVLAAAKTLGVNE